MTLEENEYTIQSLIDKLNKKYKKKFKKGPGKEFNHSDICQYCLRGYIPYKYGGEIIETSIQHGIKIITLHENKAK